MRNILFLLLTLVLLGCDAPHGNTGKDGYYFEQETFTRTQIPLQFVLYPSSAALQAEFVRRNHILPQNRTVVAFSTLNTGGTEVCTIHAVDPKAYYSPEFLGHELVHCLYGEWHKVQK